MSAHPLQCLAGSVPLITPAAAQTPSDPALAQHPSPGLSRERAVRENMLLLAHSDLEILHSQLAAAKVRVFCQLFFLPSLWPGEKQQNHR